MERLILGAPFFIGLILFYPKSSDHSLTLHQLVLEAQQREDEWEEERMAALKLMHSEVMPQSQESPPLVDMPFLPNRSSTPGAIFKEATLATICVPDYSSRVSYVPPNVESDVYRSYGIHSNRGKYRIDHLIPSKLGGSNDITNLWPQTHRGQWKVSHKSKLSNELYHRVCAGTLTLAQARKEVAFDWIAAYKKYVGEKSEDSTHSN